MYDSDVATKLLRVVPRDGCLAGGADYCDPVLPSVLRCSAELPAPRTTVREYMQWECGMR
jgi:hypothetical protein